MQDKDTFSEHRSKANPLKKKLMGLICGFKKKVITTYMDYQPWDW
jgi:hypothetical protein